MLLMSAKELPSNDDQGYKFEFNTDAKLFVFDGESFELRHDCPSRTTPDSTLS